MPSKNLQKIQKSVSRKQNGKKKALHENSRDAQRIRQASRRQDKLAALANTAGKSRQPYIDRVFYLRGLLFPDDDANRDGIEGDIATIDTMSDLELRQAAQSYIGRHDEELRALESERRPGRPPTGRETLLKQHQSADQSELASGFWVPDMTDAATLDSLRKWNGEWSALGQMKFSRVGLDGSISPSAFPPNRSK